MSLLKISKKPGRSKPCLKDKPIQLETVRPFRYKRINLRDINLRDKVNPNGYDMEEIQDICRNEVT